MSDSEARSAPVLFEAMIVPHRSLGKRGLRWVAGSLCVLSGGVSFGLWLVGARPVIGFCGLEIGLAIWLLNRNARFGGASEMLLLSASGLRIVRTDRAARRWERDLNGAWLRASLVERPGRTPALLVQERGICIEVGADLGEHEKRELAVALQAALDRRRHPTFDNAQLRNEG